MYIFYKFRDWLRERNMKKQRYKRGFSDSDCWGMCYWLTDTFPKMVYTLRDMKHRSSRL